MAFTFDRDYGNLAQVEPFLAEFTKLHDGITAAGRYAYNDDFKGLIAGLAGDDEGTGIYLLQGLRRQKIQDAYVAQLIAGGYEVIEEVTVADAVKRYRHLVLIPNGRMSGEQAEYHDARLIAGADGKPYGVLPKGKRTRGHLVLGRTVYGAAA